MFWNKTLTQQVSSLERENEALRGEQTALRAENLHLRTLLSDLQSDIRALISSHQEERQNILDKFIAVISPSAFSSLRTAKGTSAVPKSPKPRLNYPGSSPDLRPPYPSELPTRVQAGEEQLPEAGAEALLKAFSTLSAENRS